MQLVVSCIQSRCGMEPLPSWLSIRLPYTYECLRVRVTTNNNILNYSFFTRWETMHPIFFVCLQQNDKRLLEQRLPCECIHVSKWTWGTGSRVASSSQTNKISVPNSASKLSCSSPLAFSRSSWLSNAPSWRQNGDPSHLLRASDSKSSYQRWSSETDEYERCLYRSQDSGSE